MRILATCLCAALCGRAVHAADAPAPSQQHLQRLIEDLKRRLPIQEEVRVAVLPANSLMASVERANSEGHAFVLSLDEGFVAGLDDEEIAAVLAHELGHVWIFTHHPYLQTEALANRIALRLVTRDTLVKIYAKMWMHTGTNGDLASVLDVPPIHVAGERPSVLP